MRALFLYILLLLSIAGIAQPTNGYDTAYVIQKHFNNASINEYKKDKQFQYDSIKEPVDSIWDRFWRAFWNLIDRLLAGRAGRNTLWIIAILVFVAAILFIIFKMMGDKATLFTSGGKGINYEVGEENIHTISFEDAIKNALDTENYRLAVRLIYLLSLKNLSDKLLIDWKPGKTNSAYIFEMKNHPAYYSFNHLTMEFEYAWYGGEQVNRELYQQFDESFKEFKSKINL